MSEAELDALMVRLADGDRSAFEPLFRELHPRALRLARSRLAEDVAADVAQSALTKVFARASEFAIDRPMLPWFYAIVANEIRSESRKRNAAAARGVSDAALEAVRAPAHDPEQAAIERELQRALAQAIEALDTNDANAILFMLGQAPRPDLSDATFRKRVSRAVARLRLTLGGAK